MGKVVVMGASGYIGGRLVGVLQERGWDVHGVVRESAPRLAIEQTVCDLADTQSAETLVAACEGADSVIHLAGENEVLAADRPAQALASTVVATETVAEACARTGVRRMLYMSTVHVYGERIVPGVELVEDIRVEPRTAYAISRLASEHLAASLSASSYELVVLRLTNSVGAPDHPSVDRWMLVTNDLCREAALTGRLTLRSSGTQWRDFVALSDVCSAVELAARAREPALPPGTYNLGSGRSITVRELAGMIQDAFEKETGTRPDLDAPQPESEPPGPYHVCVKRAARHGLRLQTPLEAAIAETARFCLQHRDELP